ncbi:hypothetical protein [Ochrobactrum quorumnocens]|uniref:Uncharacterized protein n=1 Tax=Ochrobactrum quorumnocens TaxID=271865 RepID=A0A5N1JNB4_9HYPH|nr:hypothetical protein [[Ochrobactrum] quorumnocens]KAA9361486.1 hypothetical protein F3W84_20585 [[Ochrobactrum] quorumnocens]
MDAIGNAISWENESGGDHECNAGPTKRLLELSSLADDPRRIVDYEPQDVDEAIGKLVYLAASIISGRLTLAKNEVATVLKSVDNI